LVDTVPFRDTKLPEVIREIESSAESQAED
jgi:hypothetical protein